LEDIHINGHLIQNQTLGGVLYQEGDSSLKDVI